MTQLDFIRQNPVEAGMDRQNQRFAAQEDRAFSRDQAQQQSQRMDREWRSRQLAGMLERGDVDGAEQYDRKFLNVYSPDFYRSVRSDPRMMMTVQQRVADERQRMQMDQAQRNRAESVGIQREHLQIQREHAQRSEPLVPVQTPQGQVYQPRSQAIGQPVPPRHGTASDASGPFSGTSMEAQDSNILLRGDPGSAEYAMAYERRSRPRMQTIPDPNNPMGTVLAEVRPDMSHIRPPTYRASSQASQSMSAPSDQSVALSDAEPRAATAPTQARSAQPNRVTPIGDARIPPATLEHVRRFENESNRVIDAMDGFERLANSADGMTRFRTWIADPTSPDAAAINQAYNNMVTTLRSEAFLNTGVLQPAEMTMIRNIMRDPTSWRGALTTPEARSAQLNQIRQMIRNGIARQRASIGRSDPAAAPTLSPADPVQPRVIEYDNQGRRVPGPQSDAGGAELQVGQVPVTRALTGNGMADAGQASIERRGIDSQWNSGGVLTDQSGAPVTPGTRDNPAVLPNGLSPSANPASDFGDGMGAGDRAQVPAGVRPSALSPTYADRTMRAESGGNSNAANPRSTARGAGQFVENTWLGRADAPGVVASLGVDRGMLARAWAGDPQARQQILDMRNDPQMARRAVEEYGRQNARYLAAQGLPANDMTIGLAHFLGPAGAARFLRAHATDPNMPINRAVSSPAFRSNPEVFTAAGQPRTVGDIYGMWQQRYGGGPAPAAPVAAPQPTGPASVAPPESLPDMMPSQAPAPLMRLPPIQPESTALPPSPVTAAMINRDLANLQRQAPDQMQPAAPPYVPAQDQSVAPALPAALPMPDAGGIMPGQIMRDIDGLYRDGGLQPPSDQAPQATSGQSAVLPIVDPHARFAADVRRALAERPAATGPFSLSDPATIRQARARFAESGRVADWNAGVASFLDDRFSRAMEAADTPHGFHRAVWSNPRERAILMATMTPDQINALRNIMRVTDLVSRSPAFSGPVSVFARDIGNRRGAQIIAGIVTDPDAVARLRVLQSSAPDSPAAIRAVNAVLRNRSGAVSPTDAASPTRIIEFDSQGGRVSQ